MIKNPLLKDSEQIVNNPKNYFNSALQTVISIFMVVAVIYFIWHFIMAGYHLISSYGDPKKLEQAKNEITYAVLGLGVVFSIFAILKFVGTVLGVQGLRDLQIAWPTL